MIVQHNQIKYQTFQTQVLVAAKEAPNKMEIVFLSDPDKCDRQISADPVGPQPGLVERVKRQHV
jgi:hypothetical protein